jgi:hypothetical protein
LNGINDWTVEQVYLFLLNTEPSATNHMWQLQDATDDLVNSAIWSDVLADLSAQKQQLGCTATTEEFQKFACVLSAVWSMRCAQGITSMAIFYPPSGSPLCAPGAAGPSGQARVAPSGPMSMPGEMEFLEALYLGKECEPIQGSRVIHALVAADTSATIKSAD